jgi:lipopolysaccharide/colanic/teichoic acid biosynthesis glycosyltransferase
MEPRNTIYNGFGKRLIDVAVSCLAVLLLSPLLLLVALLVKCTSPGPVFYSQERVGKGAKVFRILKFRSMIAGADAKGPSITSSGDTRVTPFGALLRKFKIDEFPQLWNVLKGEMSIVGPRPELPEYVANYSQVQRRVLAVRPGITDIASIQYRHEEEILGRNNNPQEYYRSVVLPHKLELNLMYIRKMSFATDTRLVLETVKSIFG